MRCFRLLAVVGVTLLALAASGRDAWAQDAEDFLNAGGEAPTDSLDYEDFSEALALLIADSQVPAIAAAAVHNGEIVLAGAAGVRRRGDDTPVTIDDKFHIGSCTKSMTATLAAMLVERNYVEWTTTVSTAFPEMTIDPGYQPTTLIQLLSNSGGVPEDVPKQLWSKLWMMTGKGPAHREKLAADMLAVPPAYPPGDGYEYSNAGFAIAGHMLETATDVAWETLIEHELFAPLGMTTAGFRAPASTGMVDQPYGHNPGPMEPEPAGDNPQAIAPAGAVHCSVLDLARYAGMHLGYRPTGMISDESLDLLHTRVPAPVEGVEGYALGWIAAERDWAGGEVLTHAGSNTMFYAVIWIAPAKDFAAVVVCNLGTAEGYSKCDQGVGWLIAKVLEAK